jgi:rod shape-determining protein MreC
MKRFLSKNGIWLLAGVAVVVVVLSVSSGTPFLRNAAGVIASPFRAAGSAVAGWFGGIGDHFDKVADLQQENDDLRAQVADLERQLRQAQKDSEENQRLRDLLELQSQRRDLKTVSARVTERSVSNWASTLTLTRGTSAGVAIGDCAIDEYGNLVGVVTDAGLNWCAVTTILDTTSSIGATVFRTEQVAVAQGQLGLMSEGQLALTYVDEPDKLIAGDLVVTSGLGGYYPSGLPIGTVTELRTDTGGLTQYAVLSPKADIGALTQVFLITEFDVVE